MELCKRNRQTYFEYEAWPSEVMDSMSWKMCGSGHKQLHIQVTTKIPSCKSYKWDIRTLS